MPGSEVGGREHCEHAWHAPGWRRVDGDLGGRGRRGNHTGEQVGSWHRVCRVQRAARNLRAPVDALS